MNEHILLLPVLIPFAAGILMFAAVRRSGIPQAVFTLLVTLANLAITILLFGNTMRYVIPWGAFGWEFSFRLYHFSAFIILAAAGFAFLIALYSSVFMYKRKHVTQYYAYLLITLAAVNGAVLSDNLLLMLFFWESLLLTLFGMIIIGKDAAYKTATKALIIVGISDLCMMFGIGLAASMSQTLTISQIRLPMSAMGGFAFIMLVIGAVSKAGSMPFHSWIPDAADDAPLPFMAFLPASLEKLLGIYFLARITIDMFDFRPGTKMSILVMSLGAITILLAVLMAVVQKDYKRLLSFHAISQVGYMVLGIGTALPIGIAGGLFHMINHAMYKSCLFLTSGSVERAAGTTDLSALGGLGKKMPVTFACFFIAAASISGVPPFNGFFSKELVYDAAFESGTFFYIAAILGSFFTAASFLKVGHTTYLGELRQGADGVKESPWPMLLPMIVIAALCVLFGVWNWLPLHNLIMPILGGREIHGLQAGGMPSNFWLVIVTGVVLLGAISNHLFGYRTMGSAFKALEHIYHTPVLSDAYMRAEEMHYDPYNLGKIIVRKVSKAAAWFDGKIDYVYSDLLKERTGSLALRLKALQNGNFSHYLLLSLLAALVMIRFLMK